MKSLYTLSFFQMDFFHNIYDKCLYTKVRSNGVIYVCLYINDMLIISNVMKDILETKMFLSSTFMMKDLGRIDIILGFKLKQKIGGHEFCQSHNIEKVLYKFNHLKFEEVNTSFNPSLKLEKNSVRVVAQFEYASTISCLCI